MANKLKIATLGGILSVIGLLGYASSKGCFNSSLSRYATPVVVLSEPDAGIYNNEDVDTPDASSSPTGRADGGISFTVIDSENDAGAKYDAPPASAECPPLPGCPAPVDPLETVVTQAQNYVRKHSWKEILQQYARVPGGVIVSLSDYQGKDKEEACRLALGRLVETTIGSVVIGSVVDKTHQKYEELTDLMVTKGLRDCVRNINLNYRGVRFGL